MDLSQIEIILQKEPQFRLSQLKRSVFKDLIENWAQAHTFPQYLRFKLEKACPLHIDAEIFASSDKKTKKALITLKDSLKVECVLMRHRDRRNTVCVSSQVGCPLKCSFCATGRMGFKRNLDYQEIVEQVLFFARFLKERKKKVTNVVFMGMGEPFLNYENVLKAIIILNDKEGFNLGTRRISISTVGVTEGILRLAYENLQVNLAVSLHAPDNKLRTKLVPINKKYSIEKILAAVREYIKKTNRRVMFEYLLIRGINDSCDCAFQLAKLLEKMLCFVNLIPCNPVGKFKPSLQKEMRQFKSILERNGISVVQRYSFGQDIHAACGQSII